MGAFDDKVNLVFLEGNLKVLQFWNKTLKMVMALKLNTVLFPNVIELSDMFWFLFDVSFFRFSSNCSNPEETQVDFVTGQHRIPFQSISGEHEMWVWLA
jgi:hypothetical protein